MNPFDKYAVLTGRLLVFALLFTVGGFTSIHHVCTTHVQSCCAGGGASEEKDCDGGVTPAAQVPAITSSCHTNALLGVATRPPAIIPKDVKSNGLKSILPAVPTNVFNPQESTAVLFHAILLSPETPRFTLPKYLLNSSLLI